MGGKISLVGNKYDLLTVVNEVKNEFGQFVSECLCDCGNSYTILSSYIKKNKHNSCGCKRPLVKEEVGKVYGRLKVVSNAPSNRMGDARFNCICECGAELVVCGSALRSGHTKSCGCSMIKEKLCYGQGLYSKGKYCTSINGRNTKEFKIWRKMLERCYRPESWVKNPTYKGCEVSENFKNFQYFAEWCHNQVGFNNEGWELDKDILSGEIYSENTCCFIPLRLNLFISTLEKKCVGKFPTGVTPRGDKFRACIKYDGKVKYLGTHNTVEQAYEAYLSEKLKAFAIEIDLVRGSVSPVVIEALERMLTEKSKSRAGMRKPT